MKIILICLSSILILFSLSGCGKDNQKKLIFGLDYNTTKSEFKTELSDIPVNKQVYALYKNGKEFEGTYINIRISKKQDTGDTVIGGSQIPVKNKTKDALIPITINDVGNYIIEIYTQDNSLIKQEVEVK